MVDTTSAIRRYGAQWMVALLANMTLVTYGLQSGWVSPWSRALQSARSPLARALSAREVSWVASAPCLAAVAGVPLYAHLADARGRRAAILALAVPQALCWFIKLMTRSPTWLIVARVCGGFPAGGCFNIIPMYVKEISEDGIRGTLGSLLILMQNVGILAMYAMGSYLPYDTVLWAVLPIPVLTAILMLKAPESPAYLVKIGRIDEARRTVAWLRGAAPDDKRVQSEVGAITNEHLYYQSLPNVSYLTIFKRKPWRVAFILSIMMISVAATNGNFALVSHAARILASSGVEVSAELQALSFPAVMILASLLSLACVDRIGRKSLLIGSLCTCAVSLVALAWCQLSLEAAPAPRWMPLTAILLSLAAYAAGVSPIPYIIMSEMFHFQIRAKALGFIVTYAWLMSFVQLFMLGWFAEEYVAFFVFAAINAAGALGAAALPETRHKTVQQIEDELTK